MRLITSLRLWYSFVNHLKFDWSPKFFWMLFWLFYIIEKYLLHFSSFLSSCFVYLRISVCLFYAQPLCLYASRAPTPTCSLWLAKMSEMCVFRKVWIAFVDPQLTRCQIEEKSKTSPTNIGWSAIHLNLPFSTLIMWRRRRRRTLKLFEFSTNVSVHWALLYYTSSERATILCWILWMSPCEMRFVEPRMRAASCAIEYITIYYLPFVNILHSLYIMFTSICYKSHR